MIDFRSGREPKSDAAPQWVHEQIDLSAYAGKQIAVRFEYVTDEAYNTAGWAIDDISVPELGYSTDAETGDDGWQGLSVESEQKWKALARVTGPAMAADRGFATPAGGRRNEAALDAAISAWTAQRPPRELEAALQAAGVPAGEVVTIAGAFAEPQLEARQHFITVAHPVIGECVVENSRTKLLGTPARITRANATLGEHTDHVLRELLGLSDDEIIEAVAGGAVE